ncbi:hypothetical protein [Alteromonas macleodii]|uniref:hypothetical protein n=1 Tax=Alteromonas macleodii TaxID=28108 RepID=UPI002FE09270
MQESNDLNIALIGMWGAIGGAFFTLLGTIVTQVLTYVKDKGLAEISAKEKEREREFTLKNNKEDSLVLLFERCLSAIAVFQHKQLKEDVDLTTEIDEVQTNVAKLFVKFCDSGLDEAYDFFVASPNSSTASHLREAVLDVLKGCSDLNVTVSAESEPVSDNSSYKFQIFIDDEYIKKCFVEDGEIIPKMVLLSYQPENLDSESRRLLLIIDHIKGQINLSRTITLTLPTGSNLKTGRKRWEVDFDPRSEGLTNTLNLWKEEFNNAMSKSKSTE